jgi:hypothetical protein
MVSGALKRPLTRGCHFVLQRFPLSSKAHLYSTHSSAIGSKSRTANLGGWNAITDNEWQLQGMSQPNATRYSQEQLRKESRLGNDFVLPGPLLVCIARTPYPPVTTFMPTQLCGLALPLVSVLVLC